MQSLIHSASAPNLGSSSSAGPSPRGGQTSARNIRRALHHLLASTPTRALDAETSSDEDDKEPAHTVPSQRSAGMETVEAVRSRHPDLGAKAARREPVEVDLMSSLHYGKFEIRFIEKDGRRLLFADDVAVALDAPSLPPADRRRSCLEAAFYAKPAPAIVPAGDEAEEGAPAVRRRKAAPAVVKAAVTDELGVFLLVLRSRAAGAREFYAWACSFLRREEQAVHERGENSAMQIFHWLYRRDLDRAAEAAEKAQAAVHAAEHHAYGPGGGEGGEAGPDGRSFSEMLFQPPPPPATKEDTKRLVEGRIVRAAGQAMTQLREWHLEPVSAGWRLLGSHQNVLRHMRADGPRPPIYRASIAIQAPPHVVGNFIWDTTRRGGWDALCAKVAVVTEMDRLCKVERLAEHRILQGHAPNDYCYVTTGSYSAMERSHAIASRSVEYPNARPVPGFTRCQILCVGFVAVHLKKGVSQLTAYYQIEYKGVLNKVMEETLHQGRLQALISLRDSIRAVVISGSAPRSHPFHKSAVGDLGSALVRTKPTVKTMAAVARLTRVISKWKKKATIAEPEVDVLPGAEGDAALEAAYAEGRRGSTRTKSLSFHIEGEGGGEGGGKEGGTSLPAVSRQPSLAGSASAPALAGAASSRLQRQRSLRIETLIDAFDASAASPSPVPFDDDGGSPPKLPPLRGSRRAPSLAAGASSRRSLAADTARTGGAPSARSPSARGAASARSPTARSPTARGAQAEAMRSVSSLA